MAKAKLHPRSTCPTPFVYKAAELLIPPRSSCHPPDFLFLGLPTKVVFKEEALARDVRGILPVLIIVQVLGNFFANLVLSRFGTFLQRTRELNVS